MATFEWKIGNLERDTATGGVKKIHWACTASEGSVGVSDGGAKVLNPVPTDPAFVPYESLTKEIVLGWLHDGDRDAIEGALQARLDETLNPSTATGLPWSEA